VTISWFESRKRARLVDAQWTWKEFNTMFLDMFFSLRVLGMLNFMSLRDYLRGA
jgi:hypothetical protein